jgi:hypothetical protein
MNVKLKLYIVLLAINCIIGYGMTYLFMSKNLGTCSFNAKEGHFSECYFLGLNVDILADIYLLIIMVPFGLITVPFIPFMYAALMYLVFWPLYNFIIKKLNENSDKG